MTKKQKTVYAAVLDMIHSGKQEGDMLPTVKELSELLSVSQMTVHKALDQLGEEGLLYKAQGKGTFVGKIPRNSSMSPRLLNGKKIIAFIAPYSHDDLFMQDITAGVLEGTDHSRFSLINKHVLMPALKEEEVIAETSTYADGIILLSHLKAESRLVLSKLLGAKYPIVFIDHYPLDMECASVSTDNEDAASLAVQHLYENGHRRILHATLDNGFSSTLARGEGYTHCMEQHGLIPDSVCMDRGVKVLEKVFSRPSNNRPTAIFALFDGLAMDICHFLKSKGLKVPEDVSIIGFNNDRGVERFETPLTTIAQPKNAIGRKAVALISRMLSSGLVVKSNYFLPGSLVIRESVRNIS